MRTMVGMVAVLVAAIWIVVLTAGDANAGFADNAAAVTFVGAVALGIERLLEVFWLVVGRLQRFGGWWPLDTVRRAADDFETEATKLLGPDGPLGDLEELIVQARAAADVGDRQAAATLTRLEEVKRAKDGISSRMDRALQLAPGSSRLSLVSRLVAEAGEFVERSTVSTGKSLESARSQLAVARAGMQEALDVIDAFQDNPARRLASLILGSIIGLGVAGATSLNLFTATLAGDAGLLGGSAGVALTGIILGFGAGPTHEVVKALQRYKERKEPSTVILSGGPADSVWVTASVEEPMRAPVAPSQSIHRIRSTE